MLNANNSFGKGYFELSSEMPSFWIFFLSAQDFKFINLLADLLPQWRTLTLDVHEGKEADAGESCCREFGGAADLSKQKCWKLNSKLLEEETVVWTARAVEDF